MKQIRVLAIIQIFLVGFVFGAAANTSKLFEWTQIAELPDELGVAGAFVGADGDALIIAGGANFPKPVWESEKAWHDEIYVLLRERSGSKITYKWADGQFKLDKPTAYGASVSTRFGVVCMGGSDGKEVFSDVFLLRWEDGKIIKKTLPSLPKPCAFGSAAMIGDVIYLAGGCEGIGIETAMKNFWALDISSLPDNPEKLQWKLLPSWPGPERMVNITVAQHNGKANCIYVISGRRAISGDEGKVEFLKDIYEFCPLNYEADKYDPAAGVYSGKVNPWRRRADSPWCVMAAAGAAVGQSHILIAGGADGSLYAKAPQLKDKHPGFPKKSLLYHTITDTWINAGKIPSNQVTTTAVRWGSDSVKSPIIIASGEIRPRVRSPQIWAVEPVAQEHNFGAIDFSTLGIYLAAMVGVGVFFAFRNKNTEDFFRGGQRVPWIVAGFSIFATMLSSITFIAIPAKAYATDWVYFLVNMTAVAVAPIVVYLFLPFFRKIDATSAYEYLEKRFNYFARAFASASFILFQIGRMAVVMYLPALALAAITPMSEVQCILLMGVLSIIYCTMGGLEAVVWTDTIQSIVLLGGALLSLLLIIFNIDGGVSEFVSIAAADQKFHLINWDFSKTSIAVSALWVVVLGGIGQSLVPYTSDMSVVQRYMSVRDISRARKAIWTNAIAIIPASLLFFGVGTALYVFYKLNPGKLDPTFKTDAVFPLFISNELPVGIAGLVVAGIFAAAQSTISTSINSISTAFVTDFIRPFRLLKTEKGYLNLARTITFIAGCLGTALAVLFAYSDIKSLWDQFMTILGLLGGSMCGLFCLGIFTTRAKGVGAVIGAFAGAAGLFMIQQYTNVNLLLFASIGIVICFITGYIASVLLPFGTKDITGLTIYTINMDVPEE